MIITVDNIVDYLLEKRLIDNNESITNRDLEIYDNSRRNRNIQIIRKKGGMSYVVKQPKIGDNFAAITIQREAALYTLIKEQDALSSIRPIIPNMIEFDSAKKILIVEYIANAESLNDYYYHNMPAAEELSTKLAPILGSMIATCHRDFSRLDKSSNALSFLSRTLPSNIQIIRPGPDLLSRISPGNVKLLKIIHKYPEILDFFDNVYKDWWNSQQTVIHGDMNWDNLMLVKGKDKDVSKSVVEMKIVDWELAAIGDPAWDIGGILHEFISFWLNSLPISGNEDDDAVKLVASARYPLNNLKKSIRAFWKAYLETSHLTSSESVELLIRSTRYCALRLIQKIYNMHAISSELTIIAVYILQLSVNMIRNIHDAILYLFGIPV